MKVWIYINAKAAILAGKAVSGVRSITLTDDQIGSLNNEERHALAQVPHLDHPTEPDQKWIKVFGNDDGIEFAEPTFAELRRGLNVTIDKKLAAEAEKQERRRKEAEKTIARLEDAAKTGASLYGHDRDASKTRFVACDANAYAWPDDLVPAAHAALDAYEQARVKREEERRSLREAELLKSIDTARASGDLSTLFYDGSLPSAEFSEETNAKVEAFNAWVISERGALKQARLNEEAKRRDAKATAIRAWGTPDQVERYEAGVLPDEEALALIRDRVFAPLSSFPRYQTIDKADVRKASYANRDEETLGTTIDFEAEDTAEFSARRWAAFKAIKLAAETCTKLNTFEAAETVQLVGRVHRGGFEEASAWLIERYSAKVTIVWQGWKFSREYALPDD